MTKVKRKKGYRRGYSVALLVGFEDDHVVLWRVFSHVAKLHLKVELDGKRTDERALYNFHESIINALKPVLKEGVRSIVVAAPMKTDYAADFLDHVRKHHTYLVGSKGLNRVTFAKLIGSADQPHKVSELVKTREFRNLIIETTSDEADHIVSTFEKHFYNTDGKSDDLYSLKEIEDKIYHRDTHSDLRTGHLIITDKYLEDSEDKNRIHRLLQISENRKVKTRIINAETPAGKRISQLGGMVFFTTPIK